MAGRAPARSTRTPLLLIGGVLLVALAAAAAVQLTGGGADEDAYALPAPSELGPGVVAVVATAPGETETLSRRDLRRALDQAAAQQDRDRAPKPGEEEYGELREAALNELLDAAWILAQARAMGISITAADVEAKREKLKDESFNSDAEYREFLDESHYNEADVDRRVETQIASQAIQNRIAKRTPEPTAAEVERYYARHKRSQYSGGGTVEPLSAVRSQIRSMLREKAKRKDLTDFVRRYTSRWRRRTVCARGLATEQCSNGKKPDSGSAGASGTPSS